MNGTAKTIFEKIEKEAREVANEAGRKFLAESLAKLAAAAGLKYEEREKVRLRRKHKEPMRMFSKFGFIVFDTIVGTLPGMGKKKKRVNTFKEMYGIGRSGAFLPLAEFDLTETACRVGSFEKASQECTKWGCPISDDKLMDTVVALGRKCDDKKLPARCSYAATKDDILVIMMDGWMVHERGSDWGKRKGEERTTWHEIKSATLFTLSAIAAENKERNRLLNKHCVAVPPGTDPVAFGEAVQKAAMRMGLARAKAVYVVMDGGTYLWNIFNDRFADVAQGELDFYHASEHLMSLALALHPDDEKEAKEWYAKRRKNLRTWGGKSLFKALAEIGEEKRNSNETVARECNYFEGHKDHLDYRTLRKNGVPNGSGAMESLCGQLQQRFKGRGQFWSNDHLEHFLKAYLWHMNGELKYALAN